MSDSTQAGTTDQQREQAIKPVIVALGTVAELTGKQPRGDKADGGAAGGDLKYASESPHE